MKVLVIPEDQVLDQFVVKPIVEALFADLGQPAQVTVLPEPRLRGADHLPSGELLRSRCLHAPPEARWHDLRPSLHRRSLRLGRAIYAA